MEKQGVIKEGVTPPEQKTTKTASAKDLSDHLTKRAADVAEKPRILPSVKKPL